MEHSSTAQLLRCVLKTQLLLVLLAVALILLNRLSDNVFKCNDPLDDVTIGPIKTVTLYQWLWILMNCISLALNSWMLEELRRKRFAERAHSVYATLSIFVHEALPLNKALGIWHSKVPHKHGRLGRRLIYWFAHVPFISLMVMPSFG